MKRLRKFLYSNAREISFAILSTLVISFIILISEKEVNTQYKQDITTTTYSTTSSTEINTEQQTTNITATQTSSKNVDYTYAYEIWYYLRYEMELNKYVAAGIMGNIMTECGGQTLDIQPYITNGSGHYGICQWSLKYFPEVKDKSLHGQLEFLNSTLRWILNDFGDRFYDGFNYEKFVEIQDERVAAEAFAYVYEVCGKGNCSKRRLDHATTALKYFEGI